MKIEDALKDQFAQNEIDEANGMRWLVTPEREPLWTSVKRRIGLLWGCVTFNPDRDFHDEFRPFRQMHNVWRKVWPGDPDYDKADRNAGRIYRRAFDRNPWLGLMENKENWPDNMGEPLK